jgi:hypothetical protein
MTRFTDNTVSAITPMGATISIPRGATLYFQRDLQDWRRVLVRWLTSDLIISRTAWESCTPMSLDFYLR